MRYFALIIALALGVGFVFLNWSALMVPMDVNFGFATAKAPFGMMILVWFGVLFCIVAYGMVAQQAIALSTSRKLSKELDEKRKLASNAEDSRLSDVKAEFENKWKILADQEKQLLMETEQRMLAQQDTILSSFKDLVKQTEQSNQDLSKNIASLLDTMDDKITKVLIEAQKGKGADTPS